MTATVTLVPGVSASLFGAIHCAIPATNIASLREGLVATFAATLSNSIVKQCDEQTQTALTAVGQLLTRVNRPATWNDWGVIVCPRRPGRRRLTETLNKFRTQGAWSSSPHVIPHCLLHSLSGTISQALGAHGPNMGVGGVPGLEDSVLQTAAAWLAGGDANGLWLVWTNWNREGVLDDTICEARVALVGRAAHTVDAEPFWSAFDRLAAETAS